MNKTMDDLVGAVAKWRAAPTLFVREALDADPSAQQVQALEAFARSGARVTIASGHGTGKSALMAWLVLWGLTCYDDVKIPTTAPTAHQLNDVLWTEVRKWAARLPALWRDEIEITSDQVKYRGCSGFAAARTGRKENPEALQGFHAEHLFFLIDEASGVDDVVFQVAQGALSTKGARVLMAANPTRTSGYFYNSFHRDRDRWQRLTFSCLDSPHVARSYIDEIRNIYGEDSDIYRVRVLGQFPQAGDVQFIGTALVESAQGRHLIPRMYNFAPVILGVDVARYGGDRTVVCKRQGLMSDIIWQQQGIDLMTTADRVAALWDEHKAAAVMIDAGGVGAGVIDRLRQMGRRPIEVNFGGASALPNCVNKRAEMWWRMRDWLKDGAIPRDEDLRDDLTAPEYGFTSKGLVQLEKKEDLKKRGLHSPDLADALALTFAVPLGAAARGMGLSETADDTYDLFGGD